MKLKNLSPTEWGRLSPEQQLMLARLMEKRVREPLGDYITRMFPHEPPPRHLLPVIEVIEKAKDKQSFTCLSMPPRHGKSVTVHRGTSWWLKQDPVDTCGYFSYNEKQGCSKSRLIRQLALESGLELSKDSSSVTEWRTVEGGGLLAGGVGSGLTGQGVPGIMIVDDPFKDRADAESIVMRDRVWDWFNDVVMTRLEGASVLVIQTRWHEDDLIGRLIEKGDPWNVINFPALAEANDPLGREVGEPLWPEWKSKEELLSIKNQIGEYGFAALYQGNPRPKGSTVFGEVSRFDRNDFSFKGLRGVISVDPATTAKTHADYSVIVTMAMDGYGDQAEAYILDVQRFQGTTPQLISRLRAVQQQYNLLIAIEAVAGFKAVPQILREMDPSLRILEINPTQDKFLRAQPLSAAWNDGRVHVPVSAPWVNDYLKEMRSFTGLGDVHDDQVDGTAHGFNTLIKPPRTGPRGSRLGREIPFA